MIATAIAATAVTRVEQGRWSVVNADDNSLTLSFDDKEAVKNAYAEVTYRIGASAEEATISSARLSPVSVAVVPVTDELGTGKALTRVYSDGAAVMTHTINLYDKNPYIIAQVAIEPVDGDVTIWSNRMVALASVTRTEPMRSNANRMVVVPYDNDNHGRYMNYLFSSEKISHEVGYVYDATSDLRFGFIAGSVDHDKWKSGIKIKGASMRYLDGLELLSGYTSRETRDFDWESNSVVPHGYVKGTRVESARYFIGFFDDWRTGLETYADACAAIAPPAPWDKGNPMGWSSWGVMQKYVNFDGVCGTAEWIKANLHPLGFHDSCGQSVVSLDSFTEDNISQPDLSRLGNRILGQGPYKEGRVTKEGLDMRLGLYGCITIWDWTLDTQVKGTGINGIPSYTWRDALLEHDGHGRRLFDYGSYWAVDPTHPAVRANLEWMLERWSRFNVKYIKMDFLNSAMCEGDSWYDPEITTGVMAYNYGMKMLYEIAGKYNMYILEGISPLFPYQYAHGRRICCDRFSELGESEYVMNATSWSWWTDRLYAVNDPDHLVLHKDNNNHRETEGENRVRVTTGMCNGAFIIGDNFSDKCVYTDDEGHTKGDAVGYPEESKARALKMFGNADINAYVRENTGSFRPVDGNVITYSQQAVSVYMRDTPDYVYVAVFNFNRNQSKTGSVVYGSIGIDAADVKEIKELWTGRSVTPEESSFDYDVPGGDVRVYRIAKGVSGVDDIVAGRSSADTVSAVIAAGQCVVAAGKEISGVTVYDISGRRIAHEGNINHLQAVFDINVGQGVYLIDVVMSDGSCFTTRIIAR